MGRVEGIAVIVAAATFAAGVACAQSRPPSPRAPAAPTVPAAPPAPPSPDGASSSELALALLFVGTRTASPDAAVVRLSDALVGLFPERHAPGRREVTELATLLHDGLRRRDLGVDARRRLASRLTGALVVILGEHDVPPFEVGLAVAPVDEGSASVRAALETVRAALREAGLGEPEIVLVEDEMCRLAPRGRPRRR